MSHRKKQDTAALPCPGCGYDLRGNLPDEESGYLICPECGQDIHAERLWYLVEAARLSPTLPWKWWALACSPGVIWTACYGCGQFMPYWFRPFWEITTAALIAAGAVMLFIKLAWSVLRRSPAPVRRRRLVTHIFFLFLLNLGVTGFLVAILLIFSQ